MRSIRSTLVLLLSLAVSAHSALAAPPASAPAAASSDRGIQSADPLREHTAVLGRVARALEAQAANQKPEEDRVREQADLRAQQEMAHWAQLMFYATLVSVVVGSAGLLFLYKTLRATKTAADAAKSAAEIAERQFLASQRPKIVLRSLWADQRAWRDTRHLAIQATVANAGASAATLTKLAFGTKFTKPNRPIGVLPEYATDVLGREQTLASGMAHTCSSFSVTASEDETTRLQTGAFEFYCYGKVEYRDGLGNTRTTAFCRRLILTGPQSEPTTSCRFVKPTSCDEGYEYED